MSTKQERELERRRAIVEAACKKWKDRRIALIELQGVVTLRPLTGHWTRISGVHDQLMELDSQAYWQGSTLDEAEKAVRT